MSAPAPSKGRHQGKGGSSSGSSASSSSSLSTSTTKPSDKAFSGPSYTLDSQQGSTSSSEATIQRTFEVALSQDKYLAELDQLSQSILKEHDLTPASNVETPDSETNPTILLLDEYKRVCEKNATLVNTMRGLQQMNTDLAFYAQQLISQLAAQGASTPIPPPASVTQFAASVANGNRSHLPFIPSAFHPYLAAPADYDKDCAVCQEILKLVSTPIPTSSKASSASVPAPDTPMAAPVAVAAGGGDGESKVSSARPAPDAKAPQSSLDAATVDAANAWRAAEEAHQAALVERAKQLGLPIPTFCTPTSTSSTAAASTAAVSAHTHVHVPESSGWRKAVLALTLAGGAADFFTRKLIGLSDEPKF